MSRLYTNPDDDLGRSRQVGPLSLERLAQIEQTKQDFANYTPETHDEIMARMAKLYVDGSPEQKRYLKAHYRAPPGGWKAAAGFVVPAVLAAATGGATAGLGGLTSGAAAGGIAGASRAAITGGNILQDTLYGAAIGGLGGMASDYFGGATNPNDYAFSDGASLGTSTPNWDMYASPITGTQPGWAGGTPVNSGYPSPIEVGADLGYDTSIFGEAPANLNTLSNSGINPASPMPGGDTGGIPGVSDYLNGTPGYTDVVDATPDDIYNSYQNGGMDASTASSGMHPDWYDTNTSAGVASPVQRVEVTHTPDVITSTPAAATLSDTLLANGTNTLTGGSSGVTGAINAASGITGLINGVAGVASGVGNLVAAGNTADLQKTIEQRSDPFGSQRAFYQGQLKDSYTNPFGSAENQGLLNMYQQAAARKAAANGQRSNPIHQNIAFSNAMLPQLNEQRKTLGSLAGATIDPNGGNSALTQLNSTGANQTKNGYGQAAQGLQYLYDYFNQP